MNEFKQKWRNYLSGLDYAFQPIVHTRSGIVFGLEARLMNFPTAGFESIGRLFTAAHGDGLLHPVDLVLRKKAIAKFRRLEFRRQTKLLFNLDNRLRTSGNYKSGQTLQILKQHFIPHDALCFIVSETADRAAIAKMGELVCAYKGQGFRIALEVGSSSSGILELLKQARPDLVQLHRGIVRGIDKGTQSFLLCSNIARAAHLLGAKVIAKGVTGEAEYYACRDIEIDFIQGELVGAPESDLDRLLPQYEKIRLLDKIDRPNAVADETRIKDALQYIEPIAETTGLYEAFETFRMKKHHRFFPVVNDREEPIGILHENSFKEYAYLRFGSALLQNPSFGGKSLNRFVLPYPTAEVGHPIKELVRLSSGNGGAEGMLITDGGKNLGYLSAPALLKLVHEKNTAGRAKPG